MKDSFYITTPIYYVNSKPHIGHAYTSIASDVFARLIKKLGKKSFLLTGTDEHGQKVQKSAQSANCDVQEFCDKNAEIFIQLAKAVDINHNDFIRTTQNRHKEGASVFWQKLEQNGWIYKGKYSGYYSIRDEAFYAESEIINGKAPTGADVIWQEEESYFFKLSEFTQILTNLFESLPRMVLPSSKYNEIKSFVKSGLTDLSISRTSFDWGIQVPSDEKHVMYVWLDALTNYITAIGYNNNQEGYSNLWENQNTQKVHIIGKDILRFHAVYWPAFLIAEKFKIGEVDMNKIKDFFSSFSIIAHGWWMNNGQKMSKSIGNVIDPFEMVEKFGSEKLRYFMLKEVPFGEDGNFSEESLISKTNSDLANNIGNLCQRVFAFIHKNCDATVPIYSGKMDNCNLLTHKLEELIKNQMEDFAFSKIIESILHYSSMANEFIDKTAPWQLKKDGKIEEMQDVLYILCVAIWRILNCLEAFCPHSSQKLLKTFENPSQMPKSGDKLNEPTIVFTKL